MRPHLPATAAARQGHSAEANGNCLLAVCALLSWLLAPHQWRQGPPFSLWCQQSRGRGSGGLVSPAPVTGGPTGGPQLALFLLFALANVPALAVNSSQHISPEEQPGPEQKDEDDARV